MIFLPAETLPRVFAVTLMDRVLIHAQPRALALQSGKLQLDLSGIGFGPVRGQHDWLSSPWQIRQCKQQLRMF